MGALAACGVFLLTTGRSIVSRKTPPFPLWCNYMWLRSYLVTSDSTVRFLLTLLLSNAISSRDSSHITQERIDKLNALRFVWNASEATWNAYLEELRSFARKAKTLHVPQSSEKYKKLAWWVRNQRMHYAYIQRGQQEKSALTPERITSLEDLGFVWDINDVLWMEKFEMLKELVEEFGHIPKSCVGNQQLARWCAQQRYQYKNLMHHDGEKGNNADRSSGGRKKSRKGGTICISQQRIDILNSIGFLWNPSDAYWWKQYAALKEYLKETGHCDVPVSYPKNPQLGHWVANQKRLCREYTDMMVFRTNVGKDPLPDSGLNDDRLKALRDLGFDALPSIHKLETMVREAELSSQKPAPPSMDRPEQVPQKKVIVPFPWDEI